MGRRSRKPLYLIVDADILGSIDKDQLLDFDSSPDEPLLDELQCPHFDNVLIALRKSFSLTFPRNPFIDGLQEALREIRNVGVESLRSIPEVVEGLGLKPLPQPNDESDLGKAFVFRYCVARLADLQLKVKYQGRVRKLVNLLEERPADDTIRTLREVVSDTFEEMYNEEQYEEVLRRIRRRIGAILPPMNDMLVAIEVEPIADMRWLADTVTSEDGDSQISSN